ncbi:hypothetical protein F5B18DRAFT_373130 [Nemania serpens]|nr:hypothetical protein F5B18DRAFT_373130 [Nemania serpens]
MHICGFYMRDGDNCLVVLFDLGISFFLFLSFLLFLKYGVQKSGDARGSREFEWLGSTYTIRPRREFLREPTLYIPLILIYRVDLYCSVDCLAATEMTCSNLYLILHTFLHVIPARPTCQNEMQRANDVRDILSVRNEQRGIVMTSIGVAPALCP